MINELIEIIAFNLASIFGEDMPIYSENVPQGLETGCFYIRNLTHSEKKLIGGRRKLTDFDIMYIPSEGSLETEKELNNILATITERFRGFTLGTKVFKGTEISAEKEDGVLHYFISFNFNVKDKREAELMEKLIMKEVEVIGNSKSNNS